MSEWMTERSGIFLKFITVNLYCYLADFHSTHSKHNKNRILGELFSTYHSVYCHVEKSSWSHNIEKSVNVFKNCNHHFILIFRCWPTRTSRWGHIIQYSSVTSCTSDKNGLRTCLQDEYRDGWFHSYPSRDYQTPHHLDLVYWHQQESWHHYILLAMRKCNSSLIIQVIKLIHPKLNMNPCFISDLETKHF